MLFIITSNIIPVKSIRDYNDNFILTQLFQKELAGPFAKVRMKYDFHIFRQDEMELEQDEYMNSVDMEFHFNPIGTIAQALDSMVETIEVYNEKYNGNNGEDEDNPEQFQVVVACDKSWNNQVVRYLRDAFHEKGLDIEPLNLFTYFNIVNYDKLKTMIQSVVGSEFIYPEDPISFSYALWQVFGSSLFGGY